MLLAVEHMYCVRHLYANIKRKYGEGKKNEESIFMGNQGNYVSRMEKKMEEIKKINGNVYDKLIGLDPMLWCKHGFSFYSKSDMLMNNTIEALMEGYLKQEINLY